MHSLDELLRYAQLAAAAKADGNSLNAKLAINGATLVRALSDPGTDTQGYVALDQSGGSRRVLVAFRGTTSPIDVRMDGEAWLRSYCPWPNLHCDVHAGALAAYHRVAAGLRQDVARWCRSDTELVFVGHSLGAMIATIAAADASMWGGHGALSCVTFGSPRTGDADFACYFDQAVPDTTRVVHGYDLMPQLPVEDFGYRHVGQLVHIGDDGQPWPHRNALQRWWAWLRGRALRDHAINGYVDALSAASPA